MPPNSPSDLSTPTASRPGSPTASRILSSWVRYLPNICRRCRRSDDPPSLPPRGASEAQALPYCFPIRKCSISFTRLDAPGTIQKPRLTGKTTLTFTKTDHRFSRPALRWKKFNNLLADLGAHAMPSATAALGEFARVVANLTRILPKPADGKSSHIGETAIEGALIGAGVGSLAPGVGTVGGAVLGGLSAEFTAPLKIIWSAKGFRRLAGGDAKERRRFPGGTTRVPVVVPLTLNIDGRTLARAVSEQQDSLYRYRNPNSPASNGAGRYMGANRLSNLGWLPVTACPHWTVVAGCTRDRVCDACRSTGEQHGSPRRR